MLLAAFAVVLIGQQTVTFTHPCDNSSVVLEALGEELGTPMKPSGSVNDDYFLVRFDDVSVQEALDKIATTLNATWSEKDGIKYLGRTRQQEREDAETGQGYIANALRKWLEKGKPKPEYTLAYAEQLIEQAIPIINNANASNSGALIDLETQSPISRFLNRVIEEIGVETIASMSMGDTVQFSTSPNQSQLRFPEQNALNLLVQENDIHSTMLEKTGALARLATATHISELISHYRSGQWKFDTLTLTITRDYGEIVIRLWAGSANRRDAIRLEPSMGEGVPKELSESTKEIEWSKETLQLVEHMQPIMTGQGGKSDVPENLQELFSDPVKNEFLNWFGSKWILDAIEDRGLNAVAVLSDDVGFIGMLGAAQAVKEGELWAMLPLLDASNKFKLEDGWLTFTPDRRAEAREMRIDREALKKAIGQRKRESHATIDTMAQFVSVSDHDLYSMFATLIGAMATNDLDLVMTGQSMNADVLRLYNVLPVSEKARAHQAGATVSIPRRDAKFTKYLNKLIFSDDSRLQPNRRGKMWPDTEGYSNFGPDYDPFNKLGNGFPRGSSARFIVVERDLIFPLPNRASNPQGMTPKDLAQRIAANEFYQRPSTSDYQQFFVSKSQRLVVELQFPGIGFSYQQTQANRIPKEIKYAPVSSLPKQIQNELNAALKIYRDQYKNATIGKRVIPPNEELQS